MNTGLKKIKIEQIDKMDRDSLIHLYQKYFSSQVPRSITAIKRILAYKLQELQQSKLKPKYQKLLEEFAINPSQITERKEVPQYQIQHGQKIIKEYHGRIYEVIKTEEGFIYNNQKYKSLSLIAFRITGQKWSGPRFFNLRGRSVGKINQIKSSNIANIKITNTESSILKTYAETN